MKLSELFKKKLSEADSKYKLWDTRKCTYNQGAMFRKNKYGLNPRRCFQTAYKGRYLPIGMNIDFTSCEIINDLIEGE